MKKYMPGIIIFLIATSLSGVTLIQARDGVLFERGVDEINDNIYAGFWSRLGSQLLDFVILIPYIFILQYLNGLSILMHQIVMIPSLIFYIWFRTFSEFLLFCTSLLFQLPSFSDFLLLLFLTSYFF